MSRLRDAAVLVPLPAPLRAWVDSRAIREDRSRAAIVRRLIAEAAARDAAGAVAPAQSNSMGGHGSAAPAAA